MPATTNIQPIYIRCPTGSNLQADYNAPAEWFEILSGVNFLKILVQPEEYVPQRQGEIPQVVRSFSNFQFPLQLRETGFVVTLTGQDDIRLRYILEDIAAAVYVNGGTQAVPTQVIDYANPRRSSYKLAIATPENPYSIRSGFLEVDPGSGTSGEGTSRWSINGIRFSFKDVTLSL